MQTGAVWRNMTIQVIIVLIIAGSGFFGFAQTDTSPSSSDLDRIKAWDPDLVAAYEQNLQSIKRLDDEIKAITKGHSFLAKDETGKPYVSEEDRVRCDWKLKQKRLYNNLNKAMIMLAALYQKGGTQSELAPRFAEARDLIREIKDLNDQEYINKASKYWNNLVDIHDDLDKALK